MYAFIEELDRRQCRPDADYETARFCQIVGNFFDQDGTCDCLSLGITNGPTEIAPGALARVQTDHGDNGFYVVNRSTHTVRRFIEHYSSPAKGKYSLKIKELPPARVKDEELSARNDSQYKDIRQWFEKKYPLNAKKR